MLRVRVGFGIGGGFINSAIQSHHALHSFKEQLGAATSLGDAIARLGAMDEARYLGLLCFLLLLAAIWFPIIFLALRPLGAVIPASVLGGSVFVVMLISGLDMRDLAQISWAEFRGVATLTQFLVRLDGMKPAEFAGLAWYITAVGATWVPIYHFIAARMLPPILSSSAR